MHADGGPHRVSALSQPFSERLSSILTNFDPIFPILRHGRPPKHTLRAVRWRWRGARYAFGSARTVGGAA
jgi:hypothetical protein